MDEAKKKSKKTKKKKKKKKFPGLKSPAFLNKPQGKAKKPIVLMGFFRKQLPFVLSKTVWMSGSVLKIIWAMYL